MPLLEMALLITAKYVKSYYDKVQKNKKIKQLHLVTASASSKALLTGGYLILDREYSGLVIALSARFHSTLSLLPDEHLANIYSSSSSSSSPPLSPSSSSSVSRSPSSLSDTNGRDIESTTASTTPRISHTTTSTCRDGYMDVTTPALADVSSSLPLHTTKDSEVITVIVESPQRSKTSCTYRLHRSSPAHVFSIQCIAGVAEENKFVELCLQIGVTVARWLCEEKVVERFARHTTDAKKELAREEEARMRKLEEEREKTEKREREEDERRKKMDALSGFELKSFFKKGTESGHCSSHSSDDNTVPPPDNDSEDANVNDNEKGKETDHDIHEEKNNNVNADDGKLGDVDAKDTRASADTGSSSNAGAAGAAGDLAADAYADADADAEAEVDAGADADTHTDTKTENDSKTETTVDATKESPAFEYGILIRLQGDPQFYTSDQDAVYNQLYVGEADRPSTSTPSSESKSDADRILHGKRKCTKTGLGSSAALVSSLMSGIFAFYQLLPVNEEGVGRDNTNHTRSGMHNANTGSSSSRNYGNGDGNGNGNDDGNGNGDVNDDDNDDGDGKGNGDGDGDDDDGDGDGDNNVNDNDNVKGNSNDNVNGNGNDNSGSVDREVSVPDDGANVHMKGGDDDNNDDDVDDDRCPDRKNDGGGDGHNRTGHEEKTGLKSSFGSFFHRYLPRGKSTDEENSGGGVDDNNEDKNDNGGDDRDDDGALPSASDHDDEESENKTIFDAATEAKKKEQKTSLSSFFSRYSWMGTTDKENGDDTNTATNKDKNKEKSSSSNGDNNPTNRTDGNRSERGKKVQGKGKESNPTQSSESDQRSTFGSLFSSSQPDIPHRDPVLMRRLAHNVSQFAHCAAQGKVGSGFDVATAFYGSQLYTRFSIDCLQPLLDAPFEDVNRQQLLFGLGYDDFADPKFVERLSASPSSFLTSSFLMSSRNDRTAPIVATAPTEWDYRSQPFCLPPGLHLIMADVQGGSETPSMARKVLAWRKKCKAAFAERERENNRDDDEVDADGIAACDTRACPQDMDEAASLWEELNEYNQYIHITLNDLNNLARQDRREYDRMLALLAVTTPSRWSTVLAEEVCDISQATGNSISKLFSFIRKSDSSSHISNTVMGTTTAAVSAVGERSKAIGDENEYTRKHESQSDSSCEVVNGCKVKDDDNYSDDDEDGREVDAGPAGSTTANIVASTETSIAADADADIIVPRTEKKTEVEEQERGGKEEERGDREREESAEESEEECADLTPEEQEAERKRLKQIRDIMTIRTSVVRKLQKLRYHFLHIRLLLRKMGHACDVPIEPPSQTRLLDATMKTPGVVFAGVPGAGGHDAIFAVVVHEKAIAGVDKTWSAFTFDDNDGVGGDDEDHVDKNDDKDNGNDTDTGTDTGTDNAMEEDVMKDAADVKCESGNDDVASDGGDVKADEDKSTNVIGRADSAKVEDKEIDTSGEIGTQEQKQDRDSSHSANESADSADVENDIDVMTIVNGSTHTTATPTPDADIASVTEKSAPEATRQVRRLRVRAGNVGITIRDGDFDAEARLQEIKAMK